MKPIQAAISELKTTVATVMLVNSIVDSMVVFALFQLLMIVSSLHWSYAVIPFLLYFVFHTANGMRKTRLRSIEKKIPEFQDQLITAADTVQTENPVVEDFRKELLQNMKQIRNSNFINFRKITLRIVTLIMITFITIFVSAANIRLFDLNTVVDQARNKFATFGRYDVNQSMLEFQENDSLENILGNKSVAELGYEELKLQLTPSQNDVDINKIKEAENKPFATRTSANEIVATTDASYEENIPKDYRKIVKNYFTQISKS
jgi:hypothetical protein